MSIYTLSDILSFPVHTVFPQSSVAEALGRMHELAISSLVVVDEAQHPIGIFTERDAVRLVQQRVNPTQVILNDIMGKPPLSARQDMEILSAYTLMSQHKVRHLIVVDSRDRLAGIVTEGSFIRHAGFQQLSQDKNVESVMVRALTILPVDARLQDAAQLMVKQRLDCVIIEQDGQAVGILTERDLVQAYEQSVSDACRDHESAGGQYRSKSQSFRSDPSHGRTEGQTPVGYRWCRPALGSGQPTPDRLGVTAGKKGTSRSRQQPP